MCCGQCRQFVRSQSWNTLAATLVVLSAVTGSTRAGILLPKPVKFDAFDLSNSLTAGSGRNTIDSEQNQSSSCPNHHSQQSPDPAAALKDHLPIGSNSPSAPSSSSAGGGTGSSVVCILSSSIVVAEDRMLSRLADDYRLALPDPPGTRLLARRVILKFSGAGVFSSACLPVMYLTEGRQH